MRLLLVHIADAHATATSSGLRKLGIDVDHFESLSDASAVLRDCAYGAIAVERTLPDGDGLAWLRRQRGGGMSTPIIVLTPVDSVDDRVAALECGADDCIVKPVAIRELVARVRAVARRPAALLTDLIEVGNVRLDVGARQIWVAGHPVAVPRREMSLLELLLRRAGRVVPRGALENDLDGLSEEVMPNSIEVRVSRVRRHLSQAGADVAIQTVRGIGYMLEAPRVAAPSPRPAEGMLLRYKS